MEKDRIAENYESLKRSQEFECIVYGIQYKYILKIKKELKEAGIDSGETTGALQIYANYHHPAVLRICKKYKTVAEQGVSRHVEKAMIGIVDPITDPKAFLPPVPTPAKKKKKTKKGK